MEVKYYRLEDMLVEMTQVEVYEMIKEKKQNQNLQKKNHLNANKTKVNPSDYRIVTDNT